MDAITVSLRVTAPEIGPARVSVGRRQFSIGRPVEFDDASPHVSALEYALGAVGGELVNGLREFSRRRRIAIDAVEALVTGELEHALTYLDVVGERSSPQLARIRIRLFVSAPDESAVRTIFDDMRDRLPLLCTLRRSVDVQADLVLTS
ncbi:MAG TPA: hypothetical protein VG871_20535 [Vicinamibacterales bacterium]|nr:hypothetical protein [Vicinamibacterales bacterium]